MKNRNIAYIYSFALIAILILFFFSCKKDKQEETSPEYGENITDIDGNIYHSVIIGTQQWMVENLKVTRYRNGDTIPNISDSLAWYSLTTGAYCDYGNIPNNSKIYGRLYNFYTISDARYLCPAGWHVPTEEEWQTLIDFLGGHGEAGMHMKEPGTTHWEWSYSDFTNEYGYTALPGGERTLSFNPEYPYYLDVAYFRGLGQEANWWSSTEDIENRAKVFWLASTSATVEYHSPLKVNGLSVRCIKD
jgi:uncharacterized protein (TIGR02145 family)